MNKEKRTALEALRDIHSKVMRKTREYKRYIALIDEEEREINAVGEGLDMTERAERIRYKESLKEARYKEVATLNAASAVRNI